jgi:integrase
MGSKKLTDTAVKARKRVGLLNDGDGLYLRVAPGGSKGWVFRYRLHGRTRDMGLGRYPEVSLATARVRTFENRQLLAEGVDPIERRVAARAARRIEDAKTITFDDCARKYIDAHESGWRNAKHRLQWTGTLKGYASPVFGKLPVAAIDTGLVMRVLEPLWNEKPVTASRIRGRIESVLDWAKVRGYRTGENPARWRGHLDHLLPIASKVKTVKHYAALPYADIGALIRDLGEQASAAARALEFLILTATRVAETLNATWHEIDLDVRMWVIPASRMKAAREHRVPLSDAAVALLEKMEAIRAEDYVFPGGKKGRPLSQQSLIDLLHRLDKHVTSHGFRSSFRDWAAERTNFPREIAEMSLAHSVGDAVERAYQRSDLLERRRQLMQAWSDYCATPESSGGDVVSIRRR